MAMSFVNDFKGIVMTTGQQIVFMFHSEELIGTIKSVNFRGVSSVSPPSSNHTGIILADTNVIFSKASGSAMTIIPSVRSVYAVLLELINDDDGFSRQVCPRTRPPTQQEPHPILIGSGKITINRGVFVHFTAGNAHQDSE